MSSAVFVCLRGSYVTITHDALDLTVQGPVGPGPSPPLDVGPHCTGTPSSHGTSLYKEPPRQETSLYRDHPQAHPPPSSDETSLYRDSVRIWDLTVQGQNPSPPVLTSGGYLSMYGQHKRAERILKKCFLVHTVRGQNRGTGLAQ